MAREHATTLGRSALYNQGALTFDDIWTVSPKMEECLKRARQVGESDFNLLILGETGTGKNLLAQAIHNAGLRRGQPFVEVDVASLAETVLEAELFGCVPGAFTGAQQRTGYFRTAHTGTLFLDEIGSLTPHSQAAILTAVERKRVAPVGSSRWEPCDVRLITATNIPIEEALEKGLFRKDLYYRIARIELRLPPLRERPEDIEMLAERFLKLSSRAAGRRAKRISAECMQAMREHEWPGNVRELRSLMDRAMIDCDGETLEAAHVFPQLRGRLSAGGTLHRTDGAPVECDWSLKGAERRHILGALEHTKWNRSEAARVLGISRATLYQKITEYGLGSTPESAT